MLLMPKPQTPAPVQCSVVVEATVAASTVDALE